ncbi:hypothetical protein IMG5_013690 [Ichthyophthirius multifiliis]|uniref:Dynein regulatory complex protein 1/2 N-terminal domain-containing protein n=1 Tax=Ichthyophthirius multifiliis TaxID=5932 RepID=G0QK69_ICHMU|nr:hypothetical protein IMG5_013690 [Ichthyophthirius multifiliis]EGR34385.1 hypothetical protein IMG5_013690 [Ichthyophthirius multifiliis]|eukprot:XP_004039689.1 hypothetical protein IMG5_013690 [Ichthyophthirius multifiliis]
MQKGKIQIQVSRGNIDLLIRSTYQEINKLKLKSERFQKKKRQEDDKLRKERYESIQNEAASSGKRNAALEMKWAELNDIEECEELNAQIQEQQKVFAQIIEGKENLRKEFEDELKKKDDEYIKMLKEQSNDIRDMIKQMRSQYTSVRLANLNEFEDIEKQFEQDRQNLIKEQQTEIDKIFEKHNSIEKEYVDQYAAKEEDNIKNIEDLRIKGAKHYAELKITMETEIQDLEKCFEDMKALYQLITEKLDYSLKVLKEKHDENNTLCDELKRRENNYKNRLKDLIRDYNQKDKNFKEENKRLTQEYKRVIKQFKELQRKFKHFEKADMERYTEIQKMNEAEVQKLKEQIIKCNMTIHVQQLGIKWVNHLTEEEIIANQLASQQPVLAESEEVQFLVSESKLKEICKIILDEADFLIDDKLREELEGKPEHENISQRLDCIKKCLYIESTDEMNIFIKQLITTCRVKTLDEQQMEAKQRLIEAGIIKEEQFVQEIDLETTQININEIIRFLQNWQTTKEQRKHMLESQSSKKAVKQETQREIKERIAREGKKYWEKLTQVLPARTFRIWNVLDKSLSEYYELLLERQKLIEETSDLHNQNEELKNLLNQYIQIDHELIIRPTRLINVDQAQK